MQTEESGAHSESRALTDFMTDAYTYTKKKKRVPASLVLIDQWSLN